LDWPKIAYEVIALMNIFTHDELLQLRAALVSARMCERRDALISGISREFAATLPTAPSPGDQALRDLDILNSAGVLLDGHFPLAIWLKNASVLAAQQKEAALFARALERCSALLTPLTIIDDEHRPLTITGRLASSSFTTNQMRRWLVVGSLAIIGGDTLFLISSPALGYPLEMGQAVRLLEITLPVFLGYLGSATYFIVSGAKASQHTPHQELLGLLVRGPMILFLSINAAVLIIFGYSNRSNADAGAGMSVEMLAGVVSASIALLLVTTNALIMYLFSAEERLRPKQDSLQTRPGSME
jgi:hypothetical protein